MYGLHDLRSGLFFTPHGTDKPQEVVKTQLGENTADQFTDQSAEKEGKKDLERSGLSDSRSGVVRVPFTPSAPGPELPPLPLEKNASLTPSISPVFLENTPTPTAPGPDLPHRLS